MSKALKKLSLDGIKQMDGETLKLILSSHIGEAVWINLKNGESGISVIISMDEDYSIFVQYVDHNSLEIYGDVPQIVKTGRRW